MQEPVHTTVSVDVAIVGGGVAGLTLAHALRTHGVSVAVIEQNALQAGLEAGYDGRAFAIASASARMLEAIGVWQHLEGQVTRINEIRVTDDNHPRFLTFDRKADGDEPHGYLVEARLLRQALVAALGNRAELVPQNLSDMSAKSVRDVTLFAPAAITALERGPGGVRIALDKGEIVTAPLLVAADGRKSTMRQKAGIKLSEWSYKQVAISTTLAHEFPHGGVAHELFLKDEPFAILPVTNNRSNIVWIVPEHRAAGYLGLSDRAFLHEIKKRFGDFLGELTLAAPRWNYPLGFLHAEKYTAHRFALIGDAAHGIHPIAGQGLNLGLRDIAALTEVLVDALRLGMDIGDEVILSRYQKWRYTDNAITAAAMDAIVRLFDIKFKPVVLARRFGLGAVNKMPKLKNFFESQARGKAGSTPKLLMGERV
jgi:2-octaprenyl-6-methoxyphenol hydroxylase